MHQMINREAADNDNVQGQNTKEYSEKNCENFGRRAPARTPLNEFVANDLS